MLYRYVFPNSFQFFFVASILLYLYMQIGYSLKSSTDIYKYLGSNSRIFNEFLIDNINVDYICICLGGFEVYLSRVLI